MDVITDMLETVRVVSVSYDRRSNREPWSVRIESRQRAAFYWVERGTATVEVDGSPALSLQSGDTCLLPHGHPHTISADGEVVCGSFGLEDRGNHPLLAVLPVSLLVPGDEGRAARFLEATLAFMTWESETGRLGSDAVIARLAGVLVIQIVRSHLASSPATEPSWRRALDDPRIGAALSSIHESPNKAWTVEMLAAGVGMSRSTFAGRFAELVGEPPLHYVTRLRMQKARALLREGNATLAEVAEHAGYDSEAAFSKAFKRWVGVAPGTYRRLSKKSKGAFDAVSLSA